MQLSQFTDYALRTLMYVGTHADANPTVAAVAAAYGISRHHLVKVATRLQEHGFLTTRRGRGGGIGLARPAEEIGLGAVVRQCENLALVECMADDGGCPLTGTCQLQRALDAARRAFLATLDDYSLQDLLRPRAPLARLLAAP